MNWLCWVHQLPFIFHGGSRNLNQIMETNATVTAANQAVIVESLRSIAETVIWGDQNDAGVRLVRKRVSSAP
jgi:hypothetical protein